MHGGPIARHLDDVPAEEMSRFRYADGRTASIWEKWIEMSPQGCTLYGFVAAEGGSGGSS